MYQAGEEPDPRFSLANERTFLAGIRTSLAFIVAGIALDGLRLSSQPFRTIVAALLIGTGAIVAVNALLLWRRSERALRVGEPLPRPQALNAILVACALCAAAVLMVGMW